jgi:hypothetical protein
VCVGRWLARRKGDALYPASVQGRATTTREGALAITTSNAASGTGGSGARLPAAAACRARRQCPGSVTGARSPPLHACHVVATDLGIRARGKNCGTETGACPCGTGRARRRSGVGAGTTSPFPFGLTRLTMQKLQNREYNSKNSKYKVVDEKSLYNNCKGRHMFW